MTNTDASRVGEAVVSVPGQGITELYHLPATSVVTRILWPSGYEYITTPYKIKHINCAIRVHYNISFFKESPDQLWIQYYTL